jgi:hypothetical protein
MTLVKIQGRERGETRARGTAVSDVTTHKDGWRWGPVEIIRLTHDSDGYVLRVQGEKSGSHWVDIRVSPKGQTIQVAEILTPTTERKSLGECKMCVAYICACCGGIAYTDAEWLDSGTTLTHGECGGKTVVELASLAQYTAGPAAKEETVDALRALAEAAQEYAADQFGAPDPRCGLVQPVTVAQAEALNAALRRAWSLL